MRQLRAADVSERQRQILDGLVDGKSNGVLARQLGITIDGVKWHVSEMLWDTGCTDRYQLADWWRRERGPRRHGIFLGIRRPSPSSFAGPVRFAFTLAFTAVLVAAIYAGWTCSSASDPATVAPVSALGKVAYVLDGDLYVRQLPDGAPKRLTTSGGAGPPSWSPSGEWLAYVDGGRWFISRPDGSDRRNASGAWAPDADRIVSIDSSEPDASLNDEIVVEDADGSRRRVVAKIAAPAGERVILDAPAWSPDGTRIAFVEHRLGDVGAATPPAGTTAVAQRTYEAILAVPADGSAAPEELLNAGSPPAYGLGLIGWSHDGANIVYYTLPGFTADSADGATFMRVAAEPDAKMQTLTGQPALTNPVLWNFGPDAMLAITAGHGRETWTNKAVEIIDTSTGAGQRLLGSDKSVALEPALSPDGLALAYVTAPNAPGVSGGDAAKEALMRRKIGVLPAVPGQPTCTPEGCGAPARQLTFDPAYRDEYPRWSGDGSQILWVRMDAQDRASLWVMNADGTAQRPVLNRFDVPALPDPENRWFGYYGAIAWQTSFAWWRPTGPPGATPRNAGVTPGASALSNTLALPSLGLTLRYPGNWVEGAAQPWAPAVSCSGCVILGPPSAVHPYGVQVFDETLSFGCAVSCYVGNNAVSLPEQRPILGYAGSVRTVKVAGIEAQQLEFQRQVPLGIADTTGDYTPNREIWTLVPWHGRAVFITAFFRDGDTAAEQETRAAYAAILASVTPD